MNHESLLVRWRDRSQTLSAWGCAEAARIWQAAAEELDAYFRDQRAELLSLKQAAHESGYSAAHLARCLGDGTLENVGRKHRPRIRRADLPRKLPTTDKASKLENAATDILRDRGIIIRRDDCK